ncbi:uncharacterized protein LOC120337484 [Styela clava]
MSSENIASILIRFAALCTGTAILTRLQNREDADTKESTTTEHLDYSQDMSKKDSTSLPRYLDGDEASQVNVVDETENTEMHSEIHPSEDSPNKQKYAGTPPENDDEDDKSIGAMSLPDTINLKLPTQSDESLSISVLSRKDDKPNISHETSKTVDLSDEKNHQTDAGNQPMNIHNNALIQVGKLESSSGRNNDSEVETENESMVEKILFFIDEKACQDEALNPVESEDGGIGISLNKVAKIMQDGIINEDNFDCRVKVEEIHEYKNVDKSLSKQDSNDSGTKCDQVANDNPNGEYVTDSTSSKQKEKRNSSSVLDNDPLMKENSCVSMATDAENCEEGASSVEVRKKSPAMERSGGTKRAYDTKNEMFSLVQPVSFPSPIQTETPSCIFAPEGTSTITSNIQNADNETKQPDNCKILDKNGINEDQVPTSGLEEVIPKVDQMRQTNLKKESDVFKKKKSYDESNTIDVNLNSSKFPNIPSNINSPDLEPSNLKSKTRSAHKIGESLAKGNSDHDTSSFTSVTPSSYSSNCSVCQDIVKHRGEKGNESSESSEYTSSYDSDDLNSAFAQTLDQLPTDDDKVSAYIEKNLSAGVEKLVTSTLEHPHNSAVRFTGVSRLQQKAVSPLPQSPWPGKKSRQGSSASGEGIDSAFGKPQESEKRSSSNAANEKDTEVKPAETTKTSQVESPPNVEKKLETHKSTKPGTSSTKKSNAPYVVTYQSMDATRVTPTKACLKARLSFESSQARPSLQSDAVGNLIIFVRKSDGPEEITSAGKSSVYVKINILRSDKKSTQFRGKTGLGNIAGRTVVWDKELTIRNVPNVLLSGAIFRISLMKRETFSDKTISKIEVDFHRQERFSTEGGDVTSTAEWLIIRRQPIEAKLNLI